MIGFNVTDANIVADIRWRYKYDPESGRITFKVRSGTCKLGSFADSVIKEGARVMRISGKSFYAHRVAWLLAYGNWPVDIIDHIDGDPANNKLANLRDTSYTINAQNRHRACSRSKTQLLGVTQLPTGEFIAQIYSNGKQRRIGSFKVAEEAHQAYLAVKRELHAGNTL